MSFDSVAETHSFEFDTNQSLKPGIYRIFNDLDPDSALDLSGYDHKSIIGYGRHDGENQQWAMERLGPGYAIRCVLNGAYITLDSGISEGATMIATPYPVSWAIEPDDFEAGIYRIRWPNSPFVLDLPGGTGHTIQLSNRYPFKPTRLWRFIPVKGTESPPPTRTLEFVTSAPKKLEPGPPLITTADTIIDAEGLTLGGNGEMSITTTTTTVTTSVTTVKRLGSP